MTHVPHTNPDSRDSRIFGVNERGDGRWLAWTCIADADGRIVADTIKEVAVCESAKEAHAAADEARAKHQALLSGNQE